MLGYLTPLKQWNLYASGLNEGMPPLRCEVPLEEAASVDGAGGVGASS